MTVTESRSPLSAAARTVNHEEEGMIMIATPAYASHARIRRARPSGFDRLVMRLSLAALLWARRRADRAVPTREEHARRYELQRDRERRELARHHLARLF